MLRMLHLREDSGQDEGLRALQGFILALLLCLHLEAIENFSCGESTVVCGLAQMISKQGQGERKEQSRSQSRVLSFSLLTSRLNPRNLSGPLPARAKHTIKVELEAGAGTF